MPSRWSLSRGPRSVTDALGIGCNGASFGILHNAVATNATSHFIDMTPFDVFVGPGETLAASAMATNSGQVGIGLTWDESN